MFQTTTLLIVDDEPELCEILAEYFGDQAFVVRTAGSAQEARETFEKQTPDLAILDIRMPGEDGLSLARWIREQHRDIGIIMLTRGMCGIRVKSYHFGSRWKCESFATEQRVQKIVRFFKPVPSLSVFA